MDTSLLLKNNGLRVTEIRLALINTLNNSSYALPYDELQQRLSKFDRTTLYRSLLSLMNHGIIHKALEENGQSFYAICHSCSHHGHDHKHVHFRCIKCQGVQCISMNQNISFSLPNVKVDSIDITARGICGNCLA